MIKITKPIITAAAIGLIVGAGATWITARYLPNQTSHQAEVRSSGTKVMPFDLDRTAHVFTKTVTGGVEEVRAKDPTDKAQIDLARGHLREEASKFSRGDFSDPAEIHGANMPGLDILKQNASTMQFAYEDIADGGKITYKASSQTTIKALHTWFDAQVSDHGSDAMPGHYRPSH